jgi:hypothetical protein
VPQGVTVRVRARACREAPCGSVVSTTVRTHLPSRQRSSVVEHSIRNRAVVGSIPTAGSPPRSAFHCRMGLRVSRGSVATQWALSLPRGREPFLCAPSTHRDRRSVENPPPHFSPIQSSAPRYRASRRGDGPTTNGHSSLASSRRAAISSLAATYESHSERARDGRPTPLVTFITARHDCAVFALSG